jgi:uncharacterized sulfatase
LVVFIADDHSYLDSSVAGNEDVHTPSMARLAAAGMTCTYVFAASPSCAPSRAAMLTGLAPVRNGSMFNHQPPRPEVKKLPAYLKELGYETVAIGKVAHYEQVQQYGFDRSEHFKFHDDACVSAAVAFLRQRKSDRPLCLMVGTNWPHVPWPEADSSVDEHKLHLPPTHVDTPETRHWRARYYAAIKKMDDDLGAVFDAAYQTLGDNTLFISFSDHGAQWPFGKWNLYDAGMRVPFFAVWPGRIKPMSRSDGILSLMDVLPTLIEAGGGRTPDGLDGKSMLIVLTEAAPSSRDVIFGTHSGDGKMNEYPMRSVRTERFKYIRNLRPEAEYHTHIELGKAVDGRDYWTSWVAKAQTDKHAALLVDRYFRRSAEELYDLEQDPYEQHNLATEAAFAEPLKKLQARLSSAMAANGDAGLETERSAARFRK